MKDKRLLVVFIALVMICSVILSGFTPTTSNNSPSAISNTSSVNNGTSAATLENKSDSLNYNLNTNMLAEGVLKSSDDFDSVAGVERFDNDDEVWVIVEVEGDSLVSLFNNAQDNTYSSLQDFVISEDGISLSNEMLKVQTTLIRAVDNANLDMEIKYNYTSILNGFAAKIRYGDISKLLTYSVVKNVIVSEIYAEPEDIVSNEVKVYDTGIFDSSDCRYQGDGTVVAVLDTGIDYEHEVFDAKNMADVEARMSYEYIASMVASGELTASALYEGLETDDVYYSKKLPFSFDYADKDPNAYPLNNSHGIHVSGIIGGKSDVITGVAVNAQILGMKVFSDIHEGAYQTDILAALADCITLGVDVINMSLGSAGGYQTVSEGSYIGTLYDSLRTAGVSMIVAAGNSYNAYMGSAYGSTALTSNPDTGIIGSPSSYSTTTSVASINGIKSEFLNANDGETIAFFDNASNAASRQYDFYDMLEITLEGAASRGVPQFVDGKVTLEYVTIPYLGYLYNYNGIDVKDKIALVARGVCTFQEKALAANTSGAIAVIIYNNTTGVIRMSIGNDLKIPACSINKVSGDAMSSHATGTITFDRNSLAGPFMSDFSSWGPLPNLTLSPDITGHGGNIYSSVAGGNRYAIYSGTSMASPNVAGVTALVRQYLTETFPNKTRTEITALANQFMMSTATIAHNEEGDPYSPRKQGAGLVNLDACLSTKAYLTVDGIEYTKLSLYDDKTRTGVYDLNFNLVNFGTTALTYKIDTDVMTEQFSYVEDYEVFTVVEKAYMFDDSNFEISVTNGTYTNGVVSVAGGQQAQISIKITLSAEAKAYLTDNFENGMYVEGFARLLSQTEGENDLSIPYLAFFGDWTDAPLFDHDFYEIDESKNDPTLIEEEKLKATTYATTPLSAYYLVQNEYDENYSKNTYLLPLGSYIFKTEVGQEITANRDYSAISNNLRGTYGLYNVYMGLLRGAKSLNFNISEYYTGKTIVEKSYSNVRRAVGASPSFIYDGERIEDSSEYVLDNLLFYTEEDGPLNNSRYKVTISAAIDYLGGDQVPNNTFEFQFYVDVEDPTVTNVSYRVKENKNNKEKPFSYYMTMSVYDNHYASGAMICYLPKESNNTVYEVPGMPVTSFVGERNSITSVEIEITDALDYVDENDCLYVTVYDFAMNQGVYKISLPRNITDCELAEEDKNIEINVYGSRTVTPIVTPSDQWADGFVWTTSDENVAIVNEKGVIYGVGVGTCTITITDKELATVVSKEFGNYKETGEPIFNNATRWEGSLTINVTVTNPEGNRNSPVQPNKLTLEGFTFETSFYRYSGGSTEWNDKILRSFGGIDIYPNEVLKIHTILEPWNFDKSNFTIQWTTSNASIATVSEEGNITTLSKGTTIITGKVVDITTGRTVTSSSVIFEVSDPFVIQNYVLTKYYGYGDANGVVTLPTDVYFNAIGEYAFCYINKDAITQSYADYHYYYEGNKKITKVIIPEGIESIGKYAFYDCTALTEVVLSTQITEGVTNYLSVIHQGAFMNCTNLTSINIGNPEDGKCPVTEVDNYAFYRCAKLSNIDISPLSWIGSYAFALCESLTTVDLSKLAIAGSYMFAACTSLANVTITEDTILGDYMFAGCSSISKMVIYAQKIPAGMFARLQTNNNTYLSCSNLTEIDCAGAVSEIGDNAFNGCARLNKVSFSVDATLDNVGINAFAGCNALSKFSIPTANTALTTQNNGAIILNKAATEFVLIAPTFNMSIYNWATSDVTVLGRSVFSGRSDVAVLDLTSSKVETIEDNAFYGNTRLTKITFPSTLKEIGDAAFAFCSGLSVLTIPNGVTIGQNAFYGCLATNASNQITGGLMKVEFGKSVVIGENAFYACQNLKTVVFPTDGSIVLNEACFALCTSLVSANFDYLKVIPDYAFTYCVNLGLGDDVLSHVEKIGDYAFATTTGSNIVGMPTYTKIDLSSCTELGEYSFAYQLYLEEVVLNEELKEIPSRCFYFNTSLRTINLDKVETIGEYAFAANFGVKNALSSAAYTTVNGANYMSLPATYPGIGLQNLVLTSVKSIGEAAFYNAPWIESIKMPVVQEIGMAAFMAYRGVDSITNTTQFVMYTVLTEVDFGTTDRDISIGGLAFANCVYLDTINLANVVSIGDSTFANDSALTAVSLPKLTSAGVTAFVNCTGLTSADISALVEIPSEMFSNCTALTTVATSLDCTSIGAYAFRSTAITSFTFSEKLELVEDGAFADTTALGAFSKVVDDVKTSNYKINETFFVEDGILYRVLANGGYELIAVPAGNTARQIVVKEGTQRIAAFAVFGNTYLKILRLPMSLKTIGDSAFDKTTNLTSVEFRSYRMPELEGSIDSTDYRVASYVQSLVCPGDNIARYDATTGYVFWLRYYNFYWWSFETNASGLSEPTLQEKLIATYPANGVSYDSWVFEQIFKDRFEGALTMTDQSLVAKALIDALPEASRIKLSDAPAVAAARAAFDIAGDNTQKFLLTVESSKLEQAERKIKQLTESEVVNPPVGPTEDQLKIQELESSISKLSTTIWVLVVLLVLAVVGVVLYMFVFSKKKPQNLTESSENNID